MIAIKIQHEFTLQFGVFRKLSDLADMSDPLAFSHRYKLFSIYLTFTNSDVYI